MRRGFTLIELVVVILILGILAGIAAPKFFDMTTEAKDNTIRQSLAVVRDAIDAYQAKNNGALPGADGNQATFKSNLKPHLRNFPVLAAGMPAALDDQVVMDGSAGPTAGENNPTEAWRYYYLTGVFIVNSDQNLASDNSVQYDDL